MSSLLRVNNDADEVELVNLGGDVDIATGGGDPGENIVDDVGILAGEVEMGILAVVEDIVG